MKKQFTPEEQAIFDANVTMAMETKDNHEAEKSFCYCDGMLGFALAHGAICSARFQSMSRILATARAGRMLTMHGVEA